MGYVGAVAVNLALGGPNNDFGAAIGFFRELGKNDAIVPKQTSYARVVSGEIPILFDYDFNAYRAKYNEKGNFEFVLPCEGSVVFPYVIGLVKGAPHKQPAEKVLDYILSDKGQAIWTNAYLRPARPIPLPAAVKARFLRSLGITAVYVTHDQSEAMVLGDRIVVMRHGAIAQIGTPREIYFEPVSRFVAEFVGAANIVEGTASEGAIVLPGGRIPVPIGRAGKITLMLRPETIFVVPPDAAELKGRVESVTFVGDRQRIVIADAAARPLFVDAPNTIAATPGERVGLRIDPARIRVLPEEGAGSEGATPSPRRGEGWGEGDRK